MTAHDLALAREAEARRLHDEIAAAIAYDNEMEAFGSQRRINGSCDGLFDDKDFKSGELRCERPDNAT